MERYLAIDIGASSGRHIVGWREDGALKTKEVYRFPNGVQEQDGHLIWDVDALLAHVKAGIAAAKARGVRFGRPPRPLPDQFHQAHQDWRSKKITLQQAAKTCAMPVTTFYDHVIRLERPD